MSRTYTSTVREQEEIPLGNSQSASRPKNHASLAETFSPGILERLTCGKSKNRTDNDPSCKVSLTESPCKLIALWYNKIKAKGK